MSDIVDVTTMRHLNDQMRQSLAGGVVVMTTGVIALGPARQLTILQAVAAFNTFDKSNDPYGEHDFGGARNRGRAPVSENRLLRPKPLRALPRPG